MRFHRVNCDIYGLPIASSFCQMCSNFEGCIGKLNGLIYNSVNGTLIVHRSSMYIDTFATLTHTHTHHVWFCAITRRTYHTLKFCGKIYVPNVDEFEHRTHCLH